MSERGCGMNYFDNAKIFYTFSVVKKSAENSTFCKDVEKSVQRFKSSDWGEVSQFDCEQNDETVKDGDMVLGAYNTNQGRLWVIAESSNGYEYGRITVLFPSEY